MKATDSDLITAESYFRDIVFPQAIGLDQDPYSLKKALQAMGDLHLLALKIPRQWGGGGWEEKSFRHFQIITARYSGALAFLQTQHQSAGSLLFNSSNDTLKQDYLPDMGTGKKLVGVGFSQLRRRGTPILKATKVRGGYRLQGEIPWITGWDIFQDCIVGATLPDGQAVYGMIPLKNSSQSGDGKIQLSPPLELAAMNSTNTIKARLEGWFLEEPLVLGVKPAEAIHKSDRQNVLHQGFFALGCAQAGLDILANAYQQKQLAFLQEAYIALEEEWHTCCHQMLTSLSSAPKPFAERLNLRTWAINLAGRCAQGAIIASSGAANSMTHHAQRVYREALVFMVSGQTTAVMESTLSALVNVSLSNTQSAL